MRVLRWMVSAAVMEQEHRGKKLLHYLLLAGLLQTGSDNWQRGGVCFPEGTTLFVVVFFFSFFFQQTKLPQMKYDEKH